MRLTNKDVVEQCLTSIEQLQTHITSVISAGQCVYNYKPAAKIEYGTLYEQLMSLELEEWRRLFMWGMTLDGVERDRIKMAAHQRFIKDQSSFSSWLTGPTLWWKADENEFRAMIKQAFGPKE